MSVWVCDTNTWREKEKLYIKRYSYRSCPDIGMCRIPPLFWPLFSSISYGQRKNWTFVLHFTWMLQTKRHVWPLMSPQALYCLILTHTGNAIMKNQGMTLVLYTYKTHRYTYSKAEYVSRVQQINESWNKIVHPLTQAPRESLLKNKLKFVSVIFMTKPHRAERLRQITTGL